MSKDECVGHVAKHMYTHLNALRNRGDTNEGERTVSLKGNHGGFTDQLARRLTRYYK